MRAKVSLKGSGLIPFNYNLALAGAVYGPIKRADSDLAYSIHSSKDYKFFTFSWLQIPDRKVSKEGIFVNGGCHFLVSSPVREIVTCFVEGILERPAVKIGSTRFEVERVEIMKNPEINGKAVFKTLSPIIVRTAEEHGEGLRVVDLYPTQEKFYENLKGNLLSKYEMLYGEERSDLVVLPPKSSKQVRIRIKDTFHRASHMMFQAEGDSGLLRLGYETGFGEKNSMGFGMVRVVKNEISLNGKKDREVQ
jgi:CRISPR-associated endoribonuclease Cas6